MEMEVSRVNLLEISEAPKNLSEVRLPVFGDYL